MEGLQERLGRASNDLEATKAEVEQLKSLTLVGDQSQQDLHARLSTQAAELRACQLKVQQLQEELTQRLDLYEEARLQSVDLQAAIRKLDGDLDRVQVRTFSQYSGYSCRGIASGKDYNQQIRLRSAGPTLWVHTPLP